MTSATTRRARGTRGRGAEGVGLVALWGLCVYGSRENLEAA
jgi:hypothetical protein